MLYSDYSKVLLGITDVEVYKVEETQDKLVIHVGKPRQFVQCPVCAKKTDKVHDYRRQRVKDVACFGRSAELLVRKRRYRCACGKCFYENYSFLPRYYKMTKRMIADILSQLSQCVSYSHVAHRCGLSVTTVMRIFDTISYPAPKEMPRVLSIDEFRGNLGEKYQCIVTDAENRKVLDILPSRSGWQLTQYLRKTDRSHTDYVVSDLAKDFVSTLCGLCGPAKHCADKYHGVCPKFCVNSKLWSRKEQKWRTSRIFSRRASPSF